MKKETFLTPTAAAHILKRSAQSLRVYADGGKLPVIRTTTGTRLFRESDILKLAAKLDALAAERKERRRII